MYNLCSGSALGSNSYRAHWYHHSLSPEPTKLWSLAARAFLIAWTSDCMAFKSESPLLLYEDLPLSRWALAWVNLSFRFLNSAGLLKSIDSFAIALRCKHKSWPKTWQALRPRHIFSQVKLNSWAGLVIIRVKKTFLKPQTNALLVKPHKTKRLT
mgnify:CR=1 FL=1